MIEMFKIVKGMERLDREDLLQGAEGRIRGHMHKMRKTVCLKDVKKHGFPYRRIDDWNGLKNEVVEVKTIHAFKSSLDKN